MNTARRCRPTTTPRVLRTRPDATFRNLTSSRRPRLETSGPSCPQGSGVRPRGVRARVPGLGSGAFHPSQLQALTKAEPAQVRDARLVHSLACQKHLKGLAHARRRHEVFELEGNF